MAGFEEFSGDAPTLEELLASIHDPFIRVQAEAQAAQEEAALELDEDDEDDEE